MIGVLLEVVGLLLKVVGYHFLAIFRLFVPPPQKSIEGAVVLVTGAGHGIGRLTALKLAHKGAILVLWDINEQGNKDTAELIEQEGGQAHTYTVNVTDKERVKQAAKEVQKDVGTVNILINNAGILVGQSLLDLSDEHIIRTMNVNSLAHFWTLRAFLPAMIEEDAGHIVTIISVSGHVGSAYLSDYTASKFAARGLEESLEWELKQIYEKPGIRLTTVNPFYTNTGLIEQYYSRFIRTLTEDEVAEAVVDGILRNKRHIFLPASMGFVLPLSRLLPYDCGAAVYKFFESGVKPQKPRM